MSNDNPNFVNDLVAMAMAFKELPAVKDQLAAKEMAYDEAQNIIQQLQLRIIDLKNAYDQQIMLTLKAEEDRDEATRAFLEADDRTEKALGFLRTVMGNAEELLRAVEPPKPEPIPAEPTEVVVGQSDPLPSVGLQAQPSPDTPETSTDTVSSITSPEGAGSSGGMGESANPLSGIGEQSELGQSVQGPTNSEPGASGFDAPLDAEVRDSVDPTHQPLQSTSASPDGSTATDAPTVDASQPSEEVGYHNEPEYRTGDDTWHSRWQAWAAKMNERFGDANWPARTHFA